jgi:hypothetical protein
MNKKSTNYLFLQYFFLHRKPVINWQLLVAEVALLLKVDVSYRESDC